MIVSPTREKSHLMLVLNPDLLNNCLTQLLRGPTILNFWIFYAAITQSYRVISLSYNFSTFLCNSIMTRKIFQYKNSLTYKFIAVWIKQKEISERCGWFMEWFRVCRVHNIFIYCMLLRRRRRPALCISIIFFNFSTLFYCANEIMISKCMHNCTLYVRAWSYALLNKTFPCIWKVSFNIIAITVDLLSNTYTHKHK